MIKFLSVTALLFLISCSTFTQNMPLMGDWVPRGIVAYDSIPTVYTQWWKEISDCSGKNGDLHEVKWFIVHQGDDFNCPSPYSENNFEGKAVVMMKCFGWWNGITHSIYIYDDGMYDEHIVKHEMLHELIGLKTQRFGTPHDTLFTTCKVL